VFPCGNSFPAFLRKFVCFPESREKPVEKTGKVLYIILLREIKSKTRAENADTRSRRFKVDISGNQDRSTQERSGLDLISLAFLSVAVLQVYSWPCLLLTVSNSCVLQCLNIRYNTNKLNISYLGVLNICRQP
jgi:hypothetical protein